MSSGVLRSDIDDEAVEALMERVARWMSTLEAVVWSHVVEPYE